MSHSLPVLNSLGTEQAEVITSDEPRQRLHSVSSICITT